MLARLRQFWCGLKGHDDVLRMRDGRVYLVCPWCGWCSWHSK